MTQARPISALLEYVPQPYSMGPLLRWRSALMSMPWVSPAVGTVRTMDDPGRLIAMTFIAPLAVQRAFQAQGGKGIVTVYPKGIEHVNPKLRPSPTLDEIRGAQV